MSKKSKKIAVELPDWERDLLETAPPQPYPYPPYPMVQASVNAVPAVGTAMSTYRTVGANVMADNDATVATVHYNGSYQDKTGWHELDFSATGSSKRERGDSYDREIGELLASARAMEKMAARMKRRAKGLIRTQDSIVQHRKLAAERKSQMEGFDLAAQLGLKFPGLRLVDPSDFVNELNRSRDEGDPQPLGVSFPSLDEALEALKQAAESLGGLLGDAGDDNG